MVGWRALPGTRVVLRLGLPLVGLVAAWTPALAGDWTELRSPHFTFFAETEEATARRFAERLEGLRAVLGQAAPEDALDQAVPTLIYLFESSETHRAYRIGGPSANEPAILFAAPHAVYATTLARDDRAETLIYKQYLHQLIAVGMPTAPVWLRHGVAEFYSTFELDEREARLGLPHPGHLFWLNETPDQLLPIEELLAADESAVGEQVATTGNLFLSQAWLLFHHLTVGNPETRPKIRSFLTAVILGRDPTAAFWETLELRPAALEESLRSYAAQDSFHFLRMPITIEEAGSISTRPLPHAELLYRIGDLLASTPPDRPEQAGDHLRQAIELDPSLDGAWVSLGRLAAASGRPDDARSAFTKAVELAPTSADAQFGLGDALLNSLPQGRPQSEEQLAVLRAATEALRRAVELDPDAAEGWIRLGFALNLEHSATTEAVEVLETGQRLAPRRMDNALNLLLAYARLGRSQDAALLVDTMRRLGADDAAMLRAREIELQMMFGEAVALTRAERLDEAIVLLLQIRSETTDPSLEERAAGQLELLQEALRHNAFAVRYQEAVDLLNAYDYDAARALLSELAADAAPGRQADAVDVLLRKLDEFSAARDR